MPLLKKGGLVAKDRHKLGRVLDFVKLTQSFRQVERDIPLPLEGRLENDVEHSYQLAIVSWYLAALENVGLDLNKVIKYALVHDIVEVYAGDVPLFAVSAHSHRYKERKEKAAARRLKSEFPDFNELHHLIRQYEKREDAESKFVYAADKLLPLVSIYLEKGHAWRSRGISVDMIVNKNESKVSVAPAVKKYFDAMIMLVRKRPEYFSINPL
jgi:putative hydrolase of HD superfamily